MPTIQDSRILIKSSTVTTIVPTVPSSNDHTDGTWLITDLYKGELFINQADEKIFYRAESGIIEIGGTPDLSAYIRLDGTSTATTDNIQIGSTKGFEWDANSYLLGTPTYIASTVTDGADLSTTINQNDSSASMTSFDGGTSAVAQVVVTYGSGVGVKTSDYYAYFKTDNLTADRIGQIQDSNGTFAWLSDIPSVAGVYVPLAGGTMTGQLGTPSIGITGTGGNGYVKLIAQSSRPTAVNGSAILYSTSNAGIGFVKRNIANSADIYRDFSFPDQSITATIQAPASGTTATFANLETANVFTQVNSFPIGTLSAPSIAYAAQLTTGMWFASQTVNFSVDNGAGVGSNILKLAFNGATFNKDIFPVANGTLNIGSTTAEWLTIYPRNISRAPRSGTNLNGQVLSYYAQAGTGTGALTTAVHDFYTPDLAASGTTVQTLTKRFVISNNGIELPVAGSGIQIKEGTNATMGIATLVAGTVTISTTKVTANSRIFVTRQTTAGTLGTSIDVTARTAGTSFTLTSNGSILDTSTVAWVIVEPN
jgi:hypothetical protein